MDEFLRGPWKFQLFVQCDQVFAFMGSGEFSACKQISNRHGGCFGKKRVERNVDLYARHVVFCVRILYNALIGIAMHLSSFCHPFYDAYS